MSTNLAVEKHISVYVVRVNSDLTEGKGRQVIKAVCAIRSTAVRLARGADVQGSNGQVTEESAFLVGNTWFVPGYITQPTPQDAKAEDVERQIDVIKRKALEAGLSEADIELLTKQKTK